MLHRDTKDPPARRFPGHGGPGAEPSCGIGLSSLPSTMADNDMINIYRYYSSNSNNSDNANANDTVVDDDDEEEEDDDDAASCCCCCCCCCCS